MRHKYKTDGLPPVPRMLQDRLGKDQNQPSIYQDKPNIQKDEDMIHLQIEQGLNEH